MMAAKDRYSVLKRIIDYTPSIYGIIFCRTKLETQEIADSLIQDGYNAAALHGDLSQAMRDNVMDHFRKRSLQLLVATDVAARGIDVKELTHIINYNLPDDIETYVHRSGRTGRADKRGICISLVHLREKHKIKQIEKIVGRPIERAMIPTGKEVCEKQLFNHIDRIEHVDINREDIDDYLPVIFKKLEWMSREELITRMVALNFNRFLDYYKDAVDLNADDHAEKKDKAERKKERDRMDQTMKRLFFGVGKNNHILPQKLIGMINDVTRTKNIPIGRIDLFADYSYVDVEESFVPMILECFADPRRNPKGIVVEVAKEQPKREKKTPESTEGEKTERPKKKGHREEDRPKYKSERSRDGHEWLDPDWREHLEDIEVFVDEEDTRPSRKKRNAERGFGAKKDKGSKTAPRQSGRGRRGAARHEEDHHSSKRRGGRRK